MYNAYKGRMDKGHAFAGSNAYLSNRINTVKEVIDDMMLRYDEAKKKALARFGK